MKKKQYLENLQEDYKLSLDTTQNIASRLDKIRIQEELSDSEFKKEFYNALINEPSKIEITIKHEKYEHVLGGDGRSQPWSEEREGAVAYVKSSVFLVENNFYSSNKGLDYKKFIKDSLEIEGVKEVNYIL